MNKKLACIRILTALLLVSSMALSLFACNQTPSNETQETTPVDTQVSTSAPTEEVTEAPVVKALEITGGTGEVYPYIDDVKSYLKAPAGVNVANYAKDITSAAKAIVLSWNILVDNVVDITLCYGKAGCSDAEMEVVDLSKTTKKYELYNLYKDCDYVWRVTAEMADGTTYTQEASFHTTSLGPRVLRARSVSNTRDAGGYVTEAGGVTKQGMIIRGGKLPEALSEYDQKLFGQTLGIKVELDVRGYTEESGYRTQSPIEGARLEQIQIESYSNAFKDDWTENYRQIFSLLANPDNYPIYIHCTAGADRTGTLIFLVNALLGVPQNLLIEDYEMTSFSEWGARSTYDPNDGGFGSYMAFFLNRLNRYEGQTLAEKTQNYMLSIGVTQAEIDSIRAIMLADVLE